MRSPVSRFTRTEGESDAMDFSTFQSCGSGLRSRLGNWARIIGMAASPKRTGEHVWAKCKKSERERRTKKEKGKQKNGEEKRKRHTHTHTHTHTHERTHTHTHERT